jgi:PilZ domain-containing protein
MRQEIRLDWVLSFCTTPDFFMVETRIAPRYRVDKRAVAEYGGDKYSCVVRDLSTTGAAIEFAEPVRVIPIAKAFNLIIPEDSLKLPCRIVWRRDYRMGVAFD